MIAHCARAHEGTVEVHSNRKDGTTVTLRLPIDARLARSPAGALTNGVPLGSGGLAPVGSPALPRSPRMVPRL